MSLQLLGRPVHAVVFDFDGVLADTAAGWARAEAAFCAAHAVAYTPELAALTHGVGLDDAVAVLTAGCPQAVDARTAAALLRSLAAEHVPADARAVQGAAEVLRVLREHVPVAVASNSEGDLLERLLDALELAELVDVVVSASDVETPKPAPDVYLAATSLLGVAPWAALVVEDSPVGAAAAVAAGCSVVHFARGDDAGSALGHSVTTARSHHQLLTHLGLSAGRPPAQTPEGTR